MNEIKNTNSNQKTGFSLDDCLAKGQNYFQTGDLDSAQQCYQQALNLSPDNPDIYHALGVITLQRGAFDIARDFFLTAITLNSDIADYHKDLSTAYHAIGDIQNSIASCNKALTLDPENTDALVNMGILLKSIEQYQQAIPFLEKSALINKTDSLAIGELADIYNHLHRYNDAAQYAKAATTLDSNNITAIKALCYSLRYLNNPSLSVHWLKKLIELEPDNADNYVEISNSLIECGQIKTADHFANKAIQLSPNNARAYSIRTVALSRLNLWDSALECINTAIKLNPDEERYLDQKAALFELMGKDKEAFELIKTRVLGKTSINTDSLRVYINLAKRFGHEKQAERLLEDIIHKSEIPPLNKMLLSFTAGSFYHSLKEYDKAFSYYSEANKLKPRTYQAAATKKLFENIKNVFDKDFHFKDHQSSNTSTPIFIIGMPRSGTSLTEKILASHSKVTGAGELPKIKDLVDTLPTTLETDKKYPECSVKLYRKTADSLANEYLEFVNEIVGAEPVYFTDKMPQNFLYLAIISILFPNTKIIHCNRDPIDTCLSCYFQDFAAQGLEFAYDLDSLGHYYNLYTDLMEHWKNVLPINIYDSHYEKLVDEPESEVRKLLEFCELEWEDACMEHQKSDHITKTASYNQVRQPIYKSSKQKWKKYEKHLKPLFDALEKYKITN